MIIRDASYGAELPFVPPGPNGSFVGDRGYTDTYGGAQPAPVTIRWGDTGTGSYMGVGGLPGINTPYTTTSVMVDCSNYPLSDTPNSTIWDLYTTTVPTTTTYSTQPTSVTTTYATSSFNNTGTIGLVGGGYHTQETVGTDKTRGSEILFTGSFWKVPSGYTGGSELTNFSTVTAITLSQYSVLATYVSHDYSQSQYVYSDSDHEFDYTEGYVVNHTTGASTSAASFEQGPRDPNLETFALGFLGTTFGATDGPINELAGSFGRSISGFGAIRSLIHPNIIGEVSFTDWTTQQDGSKIDSYKFLNPTQIADSFTAGTDSHHTSRTIGILLISATASSQSAYGSAGVYNNPDYDPFYTYGYYDESGSFVSYYNTHYDTRVFLTQNTTLAGGQVWSATDALGASGKYGVTENHASGSSSYTLSIDVGGIHTFSIEEGANMAFYPLELIRGVNSSDGSFYIG